MHMYTWPEQGHVVVEVFIINKNDLEQILICILRNPVVTSDHRVILLIL